MKRWEQYERELRFEERLEFIYGLFVLTGQLALWVCLVGGALFMLSQCVKAV